MKTLEREVERERERAIQRPLAPSLQGLVTCFTLKTGKQLARRLLACWLVSCCTLKSVDAG